MGANCAQEKEINEIEIDEVIKSSEIVIDEVHRLEIEDELNLAKKLGMNEFKITIDKGSWDLKRITDFVQNVVSMAKCDFGTCDEKAYRYQKANYHKLCEHHFFENDLNETNIYENINKWATDMDDRFKKFEINLIKYKIAISYIQNISFLIKDDLCYIIENDSIQKSLKAYNNFTENLESQLKELFSWFLKIDLQQLDTCSKILFIINDLDKQLKDLDIDLGKTIFTLSVGKIYSLIKDEADLFTSFRLLSSSFQTPLSFKLLNKEYKSEIECITKINKELTKIKHIRSVYKSCKKNLSSLESECESLRKENQKLKEQNRVLQDKNELTRENRKFTYGIELLRDQVERFEGCLLERIENENKDDKERICEHVDAIKGNLDFISGKCNSLTIEQLNMMCSMHNGEEHKFDENKPALNLDLKKEQDTNLLNALLQYTLPPLTSISIQSINILRFPFSFLESLPSSSLSYLHIDFHRKSRMDFAFYSPFQINRNFFPAVCYAASMLTNEGEFKLSNFFIRESKMNEIMLASKRCKKVFFEHMTLKAFNPCNFEQIDESCIETIDFGVDSSFISNPFWNSEIEGFKNFLKGIIKSDALKESLKVIVVRGFIDEENGEKALQEFGLDHITLCLNKELNQ